MKSIFAILLTSCVILSTSCSKNEKATPTSPTEQTIVYGTVVSGMIWKYRFGAERGNEGTPIREGTKIQIHPTFVVMFEDDGTKSIVPIEKISDLKIK